jgi:hypothetical protein
MPRVKLTRKMRLLFYFLQVYIVFMFILIIVKFVQSFR